MYLKANMKPILLILRNRDFVLHETTGLHKPTELSDGLNATNLIQLYTDLTVKFVFECEY